MASDPTVCEPTVFIVDDDPDALDSLHWLLKSVGLRTETFTSPAAFLREYDPQRPGCVVLDLRMPEMSGLDVQLELLNRGAETPVIIVTGHGDVLMCATAFKAGAVDFIEKPANHQLLLSHIQRAIEQDQRRRESRRGALDLQSRLELLTPREREVMDLLVTGYTLKRIAGELGISAQTAAKHRSRVLVKMQVSTDVELARLVLPMSRDTG